MEGTTSKDWDCSWERISRGGDKGVTWVGEAERLPVLQFRIVNWVSGVGVGPQNLSKDAAKRGLLGGKGRRLLKTQERPVAEKLRKSASPGRGKMPSP